MKNKTEYGHQPLPLRAISLTPLSSVGRDTLNSPALCSSTFAYGAGAAKGSQSETNHHAA